MLRLLLFFLLFFSAWLSAQHMLERSYTVKDGLPITEIGRVVEDREGYLWASTTTGQLARFNGEQWRTVSLDVTEGKGIGEVFRSDLLAAVYAYDAYDERKRGYYLLRKEGVLASPLADANTHGYNLQDSSLVLIRKDSLYTTLPGTTNVGPPVALPTVANHYYTSATILPDGNYHLLLQRNETVGSKNRQLYYWDGQQPPHLLTDGKAYHPLTDGSFLAYDVNRFDASYFTPQGKPLRSWNWSSLSPGLRIEEVLSVAGKHFLGVWNMLPTKDLATKTIYTFSLERPEQLDFYGSFPLVTGNSNRINVGRDGTVWGAGHGGVRRMVPHTEVYLSADKEGVGSMHAIGQTGNGDVYIAGYGTGMMRIQGRQPQRLTRPPFRADTRYLPGTYHAEDGSILFNNESQTQAIHRISPTGDLTAHPMQDATHYDVGFHFDTVVLPANAPLFNNDFSGQEDSLRMLAFSMTQSVRTTEPSGRIGLTPLPYKPENPFYTIGHSKGLRVRNVLSTAQDRAGRIWFEHSSTGMGVYDPARNTAITWAVEQAGDPGGYSMLVDGRDRLWIGGLTGLYYLDSVSTIALQPTPHLRARQKKCRVYAIPANYIGSMMLLGPDTLAVGHAGGLSLIDLNSPDMEEPRAVTLPIGDYLGPSEQNGIMRDQDGHLWLIGDVGVVRLNLKELLRGRRMQSEVEIAMNGDRNTQQFVNKAVVTVPPVDRSLNYSYQLGVFDQVQDIARTEMLLLTAGGDTINYEPSLSSGKVVRQNYLEPGNYNLMAKTYYDNELVSEHQTEIRVPKRLPENWWFWPGIVAVVAGFIGTFVYARQQRIQRELVAAQMESERRRVQLETSELRSQSDRLQVSTLSNAVNPHFINNAITWLQSAYLIGRPIERMNEMSDNLAKTIRTMFTNSTDGRVSHGIDEELMLVERYLRTVNIQYDDRYVFELPTHTERERLAEYEVLLMQVQVHVENAVNHGLRYRPAGRKLTVRIAEADDHLRIEVEDEGAGVAFVKARQERQEHRSVGRGTTIMRRLQETFNRYNETALSTEVVSPIFTDEQGTEYGTRIVLTVPKSYRYAIENDRR